MTAEAVKDIDIKKEITPNTDIPPKGGRSKDVRVSISEDMLTSIRAIGREPGSPLPDLSAEEINERVNLMLAIGMFAANEISFPHAADLADMTVWEYGEYLRGREIPWTVCTEKSWDIETETIERWRREGRFGR